MPEMSGSTRRHVCAAEEPPVSGTHSQGHCTITMHRQTHLREMADATSKAMPLDAAAQPAGSAAMDLMRRWCELSELERRAFMALARELSVSSDVIERSTLDLSERFQALAEIAQGQVGRVDRIIAAASALEVDGVVVPMDTALQSVESTLAKAIETILFVSKHAMRMVYTLEDIARDVEGAALCSGQIETINRQARYLALNAAIEATRSGTSGAAFNVIAREMKLLSQETERTAVQVRERISAVTNGVRRGHDVMQQIATLDLSENILAKERIDSLLTGIASQHAAFGGVLAETAEASSNMAGTVGQLITGFQFQDRTKQHLAQVIATLAALEEGTLAIQHDTQAAFPGLFEPGGLDKAALGRIIERQTLGAMKARILTRLLADESESDAADDGAQEAGDAAGEIELF
jgi:methyl-accepting chemotaxis protein